MTEGRQKGGKGENKEFKERHMRERTARRRKTHGLLHRLFTEEVTSFTNVNQLLLLEVIKHNIKHLSSF